MNANPNRERTFLQHISMKEIESEYAPSDVVTKPDDGIIPAYHYDITNIASGPLEHFWGKVRK